MSRFDHENTTIIATGTAAATDTATDTAAETAGASCRCRRHYGIADATAVIADTAATTTDAAATAATIPK